MVKELFAKIRSFIQSLDTKDFYKYLAILLGIVIALSIFFIWRFYRKTNTLEQRIITINEQREVAKKILEQSERIKRHKMEVDKMIAQDPGFKLGGYFTALLVELHLTDKRMGTEEITQVDLEGKYRESILKTKFTDMNMKEVTELLNKLDQNKRIITKELELVSVKKGQPTIDVTLTIATLEPKSVARE